MKFFRAMAPGLVALAVVLCTVPAFASTAPGAGEGLTDALSDDVSAPAGDEPVVGDTPADKGGGSSPTVVTCSGSTVTVNLDDREYTSVTNAVALTSDDVFNGASGDTATLPALLRAMFGEYTPRTQTVTTFFDGQPLATTTEYVPGVAGMDMEWITSVVLFGVVVYCLFRLLGGIVK